ncbi:hypothetical protein [Paraburkholderia antibiotica]|uniref:Uncharacterized protein n=1 Tax=Paraburkholderia antibiotica TaxID=2728839 RepID=A0A7X9X8E7_9BURK|nr:hypothetical protein [Paraburkholderia antibiotica]NML33345.1 hypothetical protein [Paraburkholderia antibiotica]
MVNHAALGLPDELVERFNRWIGWYEEYFPEKPDQFSWEDFRKEGRELAFALARLSEMRIRLSTNGRASLCFRRKLAMAFFGWCEPNVEVPITLATEGALHCK